MEWEVIASRHREKQQASIPQEWVLSDQKLQELRGAGTPKEGQLNALDVARKSGLFTNSELEITESYSAKELLGKIHAGKLTSEEVTVAFCKRAALAQQLRQDSFKVKGHHATVGYVEFLKRPPPTTNSAMVALLLDAGATADSENNIFGRTLNPHKTSLTAGGSTGGEGALVSFRGSVLGVGTDIAGSIRIPSLCCGIYGFKPTADRTPFGGQSNYPFPKVHLPGVVPVAGPMANSVDDLFLFMETVLSQNPWRYDASAIAAPWSAPKSGNAKHLTVGVLPEDPEYPMHPPVRRALEDAVSALLKAGHKVIRLPQDPDCSAGLGGRLGFQYFFMTSDGLDVLANEIGEPLVPSVKRGVHPFTKTKPPVSADKPVAHQLSDFLGLRDAYADSWRKTWREHGLDVVIGPGAISTSVPHDTYGNPVYTLMWNVLDYPAGIIPYGFASKEKDPSPEKAVAEFEADCEFERP
ncbi:hypothetical protein COL26b_006047 [Colletotrichum chrysophilum]|uniref:uncharacterized protein n=1 Tax=Colletotrichum chrysophilum TaxID=1836956 RepID=UPI00230189F6|nr:uncharacterized protein COL26b_006047 [Colletotrichum chrysophilum]KAJ0375725.1 hypothetical protein COL26b_006047 [Colletotrichum chrysophilum]